VASVLSFRYAFVFQLPLNSRVGNSDQRLGADLGLFRSPFR